MFIATYALDTLVQVAYTDGHSVPAVWTVTVNLPAALGDVVLMEVL